MGGSTQVSNQVSTGKVATKSHCLPSSRRSSLIYVSLLPVFRAPSSRSLEDRGEERRLTSHTIRYVFSPLHSLPSPSGSLDSADRVYVCVCECVALHHI